MTTTTRVNHPFNPPHMTRSSIGNIGPCCDRAEADHPAFVDGTTTTVVLVHQVRTLHNQIVPKGTVLSARRDYREDALQEVRPNRWFKNERGNMEEERGEFKMVATPGWTVTLPGDDHLTGLPWKWAKEV